MTHIGVISHQAPSHIGCIASLGRELQQRGHRFTFFNFPDTKSQVLSEGVDFSPIGESDHPLGWLEQSHENQGKLSGISAIRFALDSLRKAQAAIFRDAPDALKAVGVELLLVDPAVPTGGTVADFLGIPFISVCTGMPLNCEAGVPPYFTPWNYHNTWWAKLRNLWGYYWNYHNTWWAKLRNLWGYYLLDLLSRPVAGDIALQRQKWKLPPYRNFNDCFSSLAQICELPAEFDFPRKALPRYFHYVGPLKTPSPQAISFPFERLTEQPLIYASLGTSYANQEDRQNIFHQIAEACMDLDAQLIISLGGLGQVEKFQNLPGDPLVVEYAPQLELLAKARLTITHAGPNTLLESLSYGVPVVSIPIATTNQHSPRVCPGLALVRLSLPSGLA